VAAEDYAQAEQVKAEMDALADRKAELSQSLQPKVVEQARQLNPAEVQLACLTILNASLVATPATPSPLGAGSQVQSLVLPGFQTADATIRNLAVSCLGLYCLGNLGFAQDHVLLLLQVAQVIAFPNYYMLPADLWVLGGSRRAAKHGVASSL
jgi:condensin complex subunit 3